MPLTIDINYKDAYHEVRNPRGKVGKFVRKGRGGIVSRQSVKRQAEDLAPPRTGGDSSCCDRCRIRRIT